jgi:hypothetical protein
MDHSSEKSQPTIEVTARTTRIEAENFRLKNDLALAQAKLEEVSIRLEKIQREASESFRTAEISRNTISSCLQEARAQSLVLEAALRAKTEELSRLRVLNQSLRALVQPTKPLENRETAEAAKRYVTLAAAIQTEEALQKGRKEFLRNQAPETGTLSAEGASRTDVGAGAVSGTSLGESAEDGSFVS